MLPGAEDIQVRRRQTVVVRNNDKKKYIITATIVAMYSSVK